ncbi:MAG: hypothetical protein L7S56_00095 [Candidatus Poseidonia sp.]|nr:hypothetical protein [Poseidonia sp.]
MEECKLEGMTYLAVAYVGMVIAIGIWTFTVMQRSRQLVRRVEAMEEAIESLSGDPTEEIKSGP